jgi:methionine sulfoxide reductase heme-binding subunit
MRRGRLSHYALWALLSLPGLCLVFAWTSGLWTYGQAVSQSGEWSAQLLILTLAVTPLRRMLGATVLTQFLTRRRRAVGVATFCYAALHTVIYVVQKADMVRMVSEARELWLAVGWVALLLFAALAATSNDAAVRALRRNWKRLHRMVYPAALLVFVHWILSAFDPSTAYLHLAVLLAIETVKFVPRRA